MIVGDLLNIRKLNQAIKGSDVVYNFAAVANMDLLKDKAISTVKYNILGTVNALEVSRKHKIKNSFTQAQFTQILKREDFMVEAKKQQKIMLRNIKRCLI